MNQALGFGLWALAHMSCALDICVRHLTSTGDSNHGWTLFYIV